MGEETKRRDILVDVPISKNLWASGHNACCDQVVLIMSFDLQLAVGGTSEKDFGMLSFASGSISMQATLQKKGHYRGNVLVGSIYLTSASR